MTEKILVGRFLQGRAIFAARRREEPLVSVVMPSYCLRDGLTGDAVASVLGQDMGDLELIVVDDGSNDGLEDLLQDFHRQDPRVTVVRHARNSGLPAVRTNEGILLARGRYLAYQFEDDLWLPDALSNLLAHMPAGDGHFVYGVARTEPMAEEERRPPSFDFLGNAPFDFSDLMSRNLMANNTVLHPRSAIDRVGLYDPHLLVRRVCDHDLWCRMARRLTPVWCPKIVGTVRYAHRHSIGRTARLDRRTAFFHMGAPRTGRLLPGNFESLDIADPAALTDQEQRDWFRRTYVIPYIAGTPSYFSDEERASAVLTRSKGNRIAVVKGGYSTSIDVTMGNFRQAIDTPFNLSAFIPEAMLGEVAGTPAVDTYVFYKTMGDRSVRAAAKKGESSSIYMMDDNLFQYHELGVESGNLAIGTPAYQNVETQIRRADAVVVYSRAAEEDVRKHNGRVFRLQTNILRRWVESAEARPRRDRLKLALLTSGIRRDEVRALWPELVAFAAAHADRIELHVWGLDIDGLEPLPVPVHTRPFTHAYDEYLRLLSEEGFDVILCPLDDRLALKRSKSPVKYLESVAAGAILLVSDADAYAVVRDGSTGLKVGDGPGAWRAALERAAGLSDQARLAMFARAKADVLRRFTTETQRLDYLLPFAAADLHVALRPRRQGKGGARIAYVFRESELGGATLHLLYHATLLAGMNLVPVICVPAGVAHNRTFLKRVESAGFEWRELPYTTNVVPQQADEVAPASVEAIGDFLRQECIDLVHATPLSRAWAVACRHLGVPLVLSLHQFYRDPPVMEEAVDAGRPSAVHCSSFRYAADWSAMFEAPVYAQPAPIPEEIFALHARRRPRPGPGDVPTILVSGTVQPRKGQLKAIVAAGMLAREGIAVRMVLAGYDAFFADYLEECRAAVAEWGIADRVHIAGFVDDMVPLYRGADVVLCASDDESQPQAILNAMAAGALAVVTPVGGIGEVVRDRYSGIITTGFEVDDIVAGLRAALAMPAERWGAMTGHAHRTVRMLCDEKIVTLRLLELYGAAARNRQAAARRIGTETDLVVRLSPFEGRPLCVFGIRPDGGPRVPFPSELPAGWSRVAHPQVGDYLVGQSGAPLMMRITCANRLTLNILATPDGGSFLFASRDYSTILDSRTAIAGGEFRDFDILVDPIVAPGVRFVMPGETTAEEPATGEVPEPAGKGV